MLNTIPALVLLQRTSGSMAIVTVGTSPLHADSTASQYSAENPRWRLGFADVHGHSPRQRHGPQPQRTLPERRPPSRHQHQLCTLKSSHVERFTEGTELMGAAEVQLQSDLIR